MGVVVLPVCFADVPTALFYAVKKFANEKFFLKNEGDTVYRVYICGAVENSGFYTFELGDTYGDLLSNAGLLDNSIIKNPNKILTSETTEIICHFIEDGQEVYPININSKLFSDIYRNANIEDNIARKIINYLNSVDQIYSKQQLLKDGVLTEEEWNKTFYRIYVGANI